MTDRDTRHNHPGYESDPPKRVLGAPMPKPSRRNSIGPALSTVGKLLTEGRRFTPIGIAIAVATPAVLIFATLFFVLGRDGLVQVAAAWRQSAAAEGAVAAQLQASAAQAEKRHAETQEALAAMQADLAAYAQRTESLQRADVVLGANLSMTCDLAAELNGGKPHESWCSDDGRSVRFTGPPLGAMAPLHITAAPFKRQE